MMVWVRLTKEEKMGKKKMNIEKLAFLYFKDLRIMRVLNIENGGKYRILSHKIKENSSEIHTPSRKLL